MSTCATAGAAKIRTISVVTSNFMSSLYYRESTTERDELAHVRRIVQDEHGLRELVPSRGVEEQTGVLMELLDDGGRRQRTRGPAPAIRLACLEDAAVREPYRHPPREAVRERRLLIDDVSHARGEPEQALVGEARLGERAETHATVEQCSRRRERKAELRLVRRSRAKLRGARLADDGHFARGHVTLDVDDRIRIHAVLFSQSQRAVDVGVVEVTARIRLEPDARRLPLTPEGLEHLREGRRADERPVDAEASFEHGRGTTHAAGGERRGDDARMARPARMESLHGGAVLEELHQ